MGMERRRVNERAAVLQKTKVVGLREQLADDQVRRVDEAKHALLLDAEERKIDAQRREIHGREARLRKYHQDQTGRQTQKFERSAKRVDEHRTKVASLRDQLTRKEKKVLEILKSQCDKMRSIKTSKEFYEFLVTLARRNIQNLLKKAGAEKDRALPVWRKYKAAILAKKNSLTKLRNEYLRLLDGDKLTETKPDMDRLNAIYKMLQRAG